jgi:hypothetical protein
VEPLLGGGNEGMKFKAGVFRRRTLSGSANKEGKGQLPLPRQWSRKGRGKLHPQSRLGERYCLCLRCKSCTGASGFTARWPLPLQVLGLPPAS